MTAEPSAHRNHERTLIEIVRSLPPHRVEQLVDFARFLKAQILSDALQQDESDEDADAHNARWDALLETDEAQTLLEGLAEDALSEHRAGMTRPISFDEQGRITPG